MTQGPPTRPRPPFESAVQVVFRGLAPSEPLERHIRQCAEELQRIDVRICGCRVLLERPHRRRLRSRSALHIRIEIAVNGAPPLVVTHESHAPGLDDSYAAAREAFDAARRQLQDFGPRGHGDTPAHGTPSQPGSLPR